jgi:hypothetical protein
MIRILPVIMLCSLSLQAQELIVGPLEDPRFIATTGGQFVVRGRFAEFASALQLARTPAQDVAVYSGSTSRLLLNGFDDNLYIAGHMKLAGELNFTLITPAGPDQEQDPFEIAPDVSRPEVIVKSDDNPVSIVDNQGELSLAWGVLAETWPAQFSADPYSNCQGFDDRLGKYRYFPWKSVSVGGSDCFVPPAGAYTLQVRDPSVCLLSGDCIIGLQEGRTAIHAFDPYANLCGGMNVVVLAPREIQVGYCNVTLAGNPNYNLTAAQIEAVLDEVFAPCAIDFTVVHRGVFQVAYDLDADGLLDLSQGYFDPRLDGSKLNTEPQIIVDDEAIETATESDHIVLILFDGWDGQAGGAYRRGRYVFAAWGEGLYDTEHIIAHETGHAIGDLADLYNDAGITRDTYNNLMDVGGPQYRALRFDQWVRANENAETYREQEED